MILSNVLKSSRLFRSQGYISSVTTLWHNRMSTKSGKLAAFEDTLPSIIQKLTTYEKLSKIPDFTDRTEKMLKYNLSGGKRYRGLATVTAYEMLEKPENINEKTMELARIMGWCLEIVHSSFLVVDDILDGSMTRHGALCWYRLPDVGLDAINDSMMMMASVHKLLRTYFSDSPLFVDIRGLFDDAIIITAMGQHLDYSIANHNKGDYSRFTIENYNNIVKYKTAIYTIQLPVSLGMLLAGIRAKEIHRSTEEINIDIATIFQIKNDFMDCFGDESVTRKTGTDIKEGTCTWPAVTALQRCTPDQRRVFERCFGSEEPSNVQRIKRLYQELELPRLYEETQRVLYADVTHKAHAIQDVTGLPAELFLTLSELKYNK